MEFKIRFHIQNDLFFSFFVGVGNPRDWMHILFSGIKHLNQIPDSSVELELLQVDYVCAALHQLGVSKDTLESAIGIHFFHSQDIL